MRKGFDANINLTVFAQALRNKGYDFVCRYYNINNPSKNLSNAEALALSAAGLRIVAVWENGFPTSAAYFTRAKGEIDGAAAYRYAATVIGQPIGTPVYFAVDYDASDNDINNGITEYFNGILDGFNSAGNNNPQYQIGVYGSGNVCQAIMNAGAASYSWLAQSTGWGGSGTYTTYNIKQGMPVVECPESGGVSGDPDISPNDTEGSFTIASAI